MNKNTTLQEELDEIKNPKPLKLEDLKENMYVWDVVNNCVIKILGLLDRANNVNYCIGDNEYLTAFVDGRFYPIQIPKVGGER